MCDVASIAVFCSESIECFPATASRFSLKLLVTIPVAPIITGIIVHFRLHIRCISIHKLLYFNLYLNSCTYYYYYYYSVTTLSGTKWFLNISHMASIIIIIIIIIIQAPHYHELNVDLYI